MIFRDKSVVEAKKGSEISRTFEHWMGQHHGTFSDDRIGAGTPHNCNLLSSSLLAC